MWHVLGLCTKAQVSWLHDGFFLLQNSFIIQGACWVLSLPGSLWSTWSSIMSAIWGSLCHGRGHREGSITGCSSSSNPFILVCLVSIFPVILDRYRDREIERYRWREKKREASGGRADRQTVPGRAESIKAHQIMNSCTLKVTNIGWGGQSCQGLDIAYPSSSSSALSSSSLSLFPTYRPLLLVKCVSYRIRRIYIHRCTCAITHKY